MIQDEKPQPSHIHTDSHFGGNYCPSRFKIAKQGSIGGEGEDNFGLYVTVNRKQMLLAG